MHNFIKQSASGADLYNLKQQHAEQTKRQNSNAGKDNENREEKIQTAANHGKGDGKKINAFSERIAQKMWQNYQDY